MPNSRQLRRWSVQAKGLLLGVVLLALLVLSPWWLLVALLLGFAGWMSASRLGRQAWSVTQVGIATLSRSELGAASVVVVGIAGVVGVLVALLAMGAGFAATLRQSGTDDTLIVMRAGAQTELNSVLDHDSATLKWRRHPQVLHDAHGRSRLRPPGELVVVAALPKKKQRP